ncbi:MAG: hypothetical protein J6S19_02890 [Lentisphaeria bacterium]|nr:hypothetical protein [Lentisphaeria bacterium]
MVYSDAYAKLQEQNIELEPGMNVVVTAKVSRRDETEAPRVVADKVELLDTAVRSATNELLIDLYEDEINDETLVQLKKLLQNYRGSTKTVFCIVINNGERYVFVEQKDSGVEISTDLIKAIGNLLGPRHCKLKVSPPEPIQRRYWNKDNSNNSGN